MVCALILAALGRSGLSADPKELGQASGGSAALLSAKARRPIEFFCRCSRGGFVERLSSLPQQDLTELRDEGGCELTCHFCNSAYEISVEDIASLIR